MRVKGHHVTNALSAHSPCDVEGKSTAGLVTSHAGSRGGLGFHPSIFTDIARLEGRGGGGKGYTSSSNLYPTTHYMNHCIQQDNIMGSFLTLLNLSFGTFVVIIGSIRRLLPNVTSGIYRAHTTWAQPDETKSQGLPHCKSCTLNLYRFANPTTGDSMTLQGYLQPSFMILGFKSQYLHKCISAYADKLIRQALCSCYTVRWLTTNFECAENCVLVWKRTNNLCRVHVCYICLRIQHGYLNGRKIAVHAVSLATVGSEGWHNLWQTLSSVVSRSSPSPVLQYVKATGRHQAIKNWT